MKSKQRMNLGLVVLASLSYKCIQSAVLLNKYRRKLGPPPEPSLKKSVFSSGFAACANGSQPLRPLCVAQALHRGDGPASRHLLHASA